MKVLSEYSEVQGTGQDKFLFGVDTLCAASNAPPMLRDWLNMAVTSN
jgi:hypothetical protein